MLSTTGKGHPVKSSGTVQLNCEMHDGQKDKWVQTGIPLIQRRNLSVAIEPPGPSAASGSGSLQSANY